MKRWHFYRLSDGTFTRQSMVTADAELVAANTPSGCAAIAGNIDPDSMRVDLETGSVVDWQPPAPSDEHEWQPDERRWQLKPAAARREADAVNAQRRIEALERRQLRSLRELLIDNSNAAARRELATIEDEITALRPKLRRNNNNATGEPDGR